MRTRLGPPSLLARMFHTIGPIAPSSLEKGSTSRRAYDHRTLAVCGLTLAASTMLSNRYELTGFRGAPVARTLAPALTPCLPLVAVQESPSRRKPCSFSPTPLFETIELDKSTSLIEHSLEHGGSPGAMVARWSPKSATNPG